MRRVYRQCLGTNLIPCVHSYITQCNKPLIHSLTVSPASHYYYYWLTALLMAHSCMAGGIDLKAYQMVHIRHSLFSSANKHM
jgi:hypothetical protein